LVSTALGEFVTHSFCVFSVFFITEEHESCTWPGSSSSNAACIIATWLLGLVRVRLGLRLRLRLRVRVRVRWR